MEPRVHAGDPQLRHLVAQSGDERAAACRVGPRRPGQMAGQVPRGDEVGQGIAARRAADSRAQRELVGRRDIPFDARRLGDPLPAPDLREGIPVPASVRALAGRHQWRTRLEDR